MLESTTDGKMVMMEKSFYIYIYFRYALKSKIFLHPVYTRFPCYIVMWILYVSTYDNKFNKYLTDKNLYYVCNSIQLAFLETV